MKNTLLYFSIVLLSTPLTTGVAFSEDCRGQSSFNNQSTSDSGHIISSQRKGTNPVVSVLHRGSTTYSCNHLLSLDLGRLKREAEMDIAFKHTYETPTSPNLLIVFKMVLDEFTIFKGIKRFLDRIETQVDNYRRKYKLKGEVGFVEPHYTHPYSGPIQYSRNQPRSMLVSETGFSSFMPKKISWRFDSDLSSTYLQGEVKLGNHFYIEGNWGSDSDVKAMISLPF